LLSVHWLAAHKRLPINPQTARAKTYSENENEKTSKKVSRVEQKHTPSTGLSFSCCSARSRASQDLRRDHHPTWRTLPG
jgi:hypothetical protein